jgi:hypothetical protein
MTTETLNSSYRGFVIRYNQRKCTWPYASVWQVLGEAFK